MFHARLAPTCPLEIPLVNGPAPIPDAQITASSQLDDVSYGAQQARLISTTAWCPSSEALATVPNVYIQVHVQEVC